MGMMRAVNITQPALPPTGLGLGAGLGGLDANSLWVNAGGEHVEHLARAVRLVVVPVQPRRGAAEAPCGGLCTDRLFFSDDSCCRVFFVGI